MIGAHTRPIAEGAASCPGGADAVHESPRNDLPELDMPHRLSRHGLDRLSFDEVPALNARSNQEPIQGLLDRRRRSIDGEPILGSIPGHRGDLLPLAGGDVHLAVPAEAGVGRPAIADERPEDRLAFDLRPRSA